jgi:hypothetical protein
MSSTCLQTVVVGKLCGGKVLVSIVVVDGDKGAYHVFKSTFGAFGLAVGFRVVAGGERQAGAQQFEKGLPEIASEAWIAV